MMSDDMLSQDEINALLNGNTDEPAPEQNKEVAIDDHLSPIEQDALGEIGNISFGSSATALSTLLNQKVEITTPAVSLVDRNNLEDEFPHPYVAIQVSYTEGFSGINLLVIKQSDAAIIADLMLGGNGENPTDELGDIHLSAVQEAMNQMMGSAATSMSTIFSKRVDISPPSIDLLDLAQGEGAEKIPPEDLLVRVSFRLTVSHLIDSNIMQLLPLDFAKDLVTDLMQQEGSDVNAGKAETTATVAPPAQEKTAIGNQQPFAQGGQAMPSGSQEQYQEFAQPESFHYTQPAYQPAQPTNVQPAVFSNFESQGMQQSEVKNLNMLLDIPLQVTVELGRTTRPVEEILDLSSGSIIELDKLAGEPVDILVNSRLIAKGEVVVIDENFGVRVTDIMSQTDRLKKLK
ncbi:flagellar motor switch phosphatase FliY [Bacillus chungangensis]|uniref:Flagellar motor switch protein FliN n=1 Tax=Bacillus chungangensis TaxID=587633 RepID=A0ABT9WRH4_9BACI|nr:flagellar motor switch phosphatase FliY [Bacillus chungangensis]MDQ0175812.1 flagellar motor switch protein FliN/FliY [Bacillus chungangensis]